VHPPLAVINLSRVYAAWKGIDDDQQIYWSSLGGQNWAPQQKIEGAGTSVGPSLAVVGVEPFALWKGVDGDSRILWTRYDGQIWRPQQVIRGIGTSARPALVLHPGDGKLYAAWRGVDDDQEIY
jgi:hypothetical protein